MRQEQQPKLLRREIDLRLVPLSFLAVISFGAALLVLPFVRQQGQFVGFLDALFMATSGTCVTGLTTINVAATFNFGGQLVVLLLIQTGGLGIITASTLLVMLSGSRLSLTDEQTIQATVGKLRHAAPLDVFIYACFFVFIFELAGTVTLLALLNKVAPDQAAGQQIWAAVFHSISAFCNAGISIFPEGMARWRHYPSVLWVVSLLVAAGGIGLLTLVNLRYYYFWRRDPRRRGLLTLQTRLCLLMAALLLCAGAVFTLCFEWNRTLAGASWLDRVTWSAFHSAMTRTAGFNVTDTGQMHPASLLGTIGLMFIGGSPGSMAGGIKTITLVLLVMTAWTAFRRQEDVQLFGRRVSPQLSGVAIMIALIAGAFVMLGVGLLMMSESGHPASQGPHGWLAVVFETVSAFGTVGLSTGITPLLTGTGKLIIILLMFVGRVGPLMLAIYLSRPAIPRHVRFPKEELSLG